jgi:hypothetical protein
MNEGAGEIQWRDFRCAIAERRRFGPDGGRLVDVVSAGATCTRTLVTSSVCSCQHATAIRFSPGLMSAGAEHSGM